MGLLDIETRSGDAAVRGARRAQERGMHTYWVPGGWRDPLTLLAVAGQHVDAIELGSSIVSIFGIHPTALAEQALTVNASVSGRLVLGVGVSHRHMVEERFGASFDRPVRYLREYLTILRSLLDTGAVDVRGEVLSAHTDLRVEHTPRLTVLVAALSDQSLRVAGRLADGTLTTWIASATLASHTVPTITAAAAHAGRPAPRIVASLPVCVTADADGARQRAAELFDVYRTRYVTYQRTFERQGVGGPADLVLAGDEERVADEVARLEEAGATDYCAYPFGTPEEEERTVSVLTAMAAERRRPL
jgi:5,10-methylenetetrahydromethanopterin reductase